MIIVIVVQPVMAIPTVIILVIFYFIRKFYLRSASGIKRLEATGMEHIMDNKYIYLVQCSVCNYEFNILTQ